MLYALPTLQAMSPSVTSLSRVWYTHERETDHVVATWRSGNGLVWIRAKTLLPKRTDATTLSKDWVNCDLKSSKEVQHYKQTSVVKSLSEVRRALSHAWLQKKSLDTQKIMMIKEPSLPKNWRLTSKDSYKKKTRRMSKGMGERGLRLGLQLQQEGGREILLYREKDLEPEGESYCTLRLRELLTSTLVLREEN